MTKIKRPLVLLCLSAAFVFGSSTVASADYESIAVEQTDFIQSHFYDSSAQLYFKHIPNAAGDDSDTWGNGVELEVLANAAHYFPDKYSGNLHDFTIGIHAYWDPAGPFGDYNATRSGIKGDDRYYDDNEWLVLGFVDAYHATNDTYYLDLAKKTQEFVLSGWDDRLGGGIFWNTDHLTKNTCSNAPAAAAALRLAQITNDQTQVDAAVKIRNWVDATLLAPDGLYWDSIALNHRIGKAKYTYNSALMIYTNVLLFERTHDTQYLDEARHIADASIAKWGDPVNGGLQLTEDSPLFTHLLCESLIKLYEASKDVKYLNIVRSEASFALHFARNTQGGFFDRWTADPNKQNNPNDAETLILSASAARIFWMLAPYPDVDALYASGIAKATTGDFADAEGLFSQAVASDPRDIKSKYRLWKVYLHENKTAEAATTAAQLTTLATDPTIAQQLSNLGWKQPPVTN